MGKRFQRIVTGLVLLALTNLLPVGTALGRENSPPRAENGWLDLRSWDFDRNGAVALDGQWNFVWKRFITPWQARADDAAAPVSVLNVPFVWNDHPQVADQGNGFGYATYRLRIRLPDTPAPLALHVIDVATACTLYVDGRPVYRAGSPGTARDASQPSFKPEIADLGVVAGEIDLVAHVANYHHRQGGIWDRITLGRPAPIHTLRERRIVFNMILFGSLLLIGLYHLGVYGLRRDDPAPLYFGLACLAITLRTVTTGERYLIQVFPSFPFEWLSKLEYWGFYLSLGCFALFARYLFPQESDRRVIFGLAALSAAFSLLVLVTPLYVYSYTTPFFEGLTLLAMGYGLVILGKALAAKRTGAEICLIGFLVLLVTTINDILYSRQVIHTFYMVQFGLFFFVLSQAFLLSLRFSELFDLVATQRIQLKISEEKYRQLVDNANEAIFILQDGVFKFVNPRTGGLLGFDRRDLRSLPFLSCVHLGDRSELESRLQKGIDDGDGVDSASFRVIKPSGRVAWVQLNAVPTSWGQRPALLGFLSDVSRPKEQEALLHRIQKMEALVTLAGGLAHDINTFIAVVIRNTEQALEKLSGDDGAAPFLKQVVASSHRARRLVERVLVFSRRGQQKQHPVVIATEVERVLERFRVDTIGSPIQVHADITAREARVMANEEQIRDVVRHLGENGLDAMKTTGGILNIALHEVRVSSVNGSGASGLAPGTYVRLTVADNGQGIPEEIQDRIFDPYFTTKPAGEGTGLGLSAVMGIVKTHKGDIGLISSPGTGTTFHVYFPVLSSGGHGEIAA